MAGTPRLKSRTLCHLGRALPSGNSAFIPFRYHASLSRSLSQRAKDDTLADPQKWGAYRPVLRRIQRSQAIFLAEDANFLASTERTPELWLVDWQKRLRPTGMPAWPTSTQYSYLPDSPEGRQVIDTNSNAWRTGYFLRRACVSAVVRGFQPAWEIKARRVCIETQDARFPTVYHTAEEQAHSLYLLGRVELERGQRFRSVAWFMLSVSAGLGHLDAALLLHQLGKLDKQYAPQAEQIEAIATAAQAKTDWRTIVAHCENLVSTSKGVTGKLNTSVLDQCLDLLADAMKRTGPAQGNKVEKETPSGQELDVESLEIFQPPYKLLLEITENEINLGNNSEQVVTLFKQAARMGVLEYNDSEAASQLIRSQQSSDETDRDSILETYTKIAAKDYNPDACFEVAKFYLRKDGWYPSIAEKVMEDVERHDEELRRTSKTTEEFKSRMWDEDYVEKMILKKKKDLPTRGMEWMRLAAQLRIDSASDIVNQYYIMIGLLRQNGFLDEGRKVLTEALEAVDMCPEDTTKERLILDDAFTHWDRRVQDILTSREMNTLLGIQKT